MLWKAITMLWTVVLIPSLWSIGTSSSQFVVAAQELDEPSWFGHVLQTFPGINLRTCSARSKAPKTGDRCGRINKTCFFGNQQCSGIGSYPTIRCNCFSTSWTCIPTGCPGVPTGAPTPAPTANAAPPLGMTESPSKDPSLVPTGLMSMAPTVRVPDLLPTFPPSEATMNPPTDPPMFPPTVDPTNRPSKVPTKRPTIPLTIDPTPRPTLRPTRPPTTVV